MCPNSWQYTPISLSWPGWKPDSSGSIVKRSMRIGRDVPGMKSLHTAAVPPFQPAVARDVSDQKSPRRPVTSAPGPACTSHSMSTYPSPSRSKRPKFTLSSQAKTASRNMP